MTTIKNKADDIRKVINEMVFLSDVPNCIFDAIEENDILFNFILYTIENIYGKMLTMKFLSYKKVINLFHEYLLRLDECFDCENLAEIKMYLDNKLKQALDTAMQYELFEVVNNINTWYEIKNELTQITL